MDAEKSILLSIRSLVVGDSTDDGFDTDLKIHINSALFDLHDLGVGPVEGFKIESEAEEWTGLIADSKNLEVIKSFIYLKVKIVFDPPASSFVMEAYLKEIDRYAWAIRNAMELN